MNIDLDLYKKFLLPECDRCAFIQVYFNKSGIECPVIGLGKKKHLYVKFPLSQYNPSFTIKTVIAHYDRFDGSPGANDNSSSVLAIMNWAVNLNKTNRVHNVRIIFTDGEELGESGGVAEQGAFPLAQMFRRLGITNNDVFVFDCMGRGDVPILAQAIVPPNVSTKFLQEFSDLELRAKNLLKAASGGKWFCLPCNYSDNASFIANGIPSVAITMLPSEEVETVLATGTCPTWQMFHTPQDNLQSLNPQSFELFHAILNKLTFLR